MERERERERKIERDIPIYRGAWASLLGCSGVNSGTCQRQTKDVLGYFWRCSKGMLGMCWRCFDGSMYRFRTIETNYIAP